MEIIKIIGVGLVSLVIIIIIRQYRPEFAIYVSLIAGTIILFMVLPKLASIVNVITALTAKTNINSEFIKILLKITGIAILTEFAVSICKDSGESTIASKMDLGGKIIIVSMSIPIVSTMLELVMKILP